MKAGSGEDVSRLDALTMLSGAPGVAWVKPQGQHTACSTEIATAPAWPLSRGLSKRPCNGGATSNSRGKSRR